MTEDYKHGDKDTNIIGVISEAVGYCSVKAGSSHQTIFEK